MALVKTHTCSPPPVSNRTSVAIETVSLLTRLNIDHSRTRRVERRPLPLSTPLSFRQSMVQCCGVSLFKNFLKPPALPSSYAIDSCDACRVCQTRLPIHSSVTLAVMTVGAIIFVHSSSICLASGSGSGYIHHRSQSMAINATEQGERINCFYIGLHFYLSLPCLSELCWVVTTIMFKIWLKTLLLSVLFS